MALSVPGVIVPAMASSGSAGAAAESGEAGTTVRTRRLPRGAVAVSVIGSLVAFVVLSTLATLAGRWAAEAEAEDDAGALAAVSTRVALAPYLTDALLQGEPAALAAIDAAGRGLLDAGDVVHVKIWAGDGRIVWSENPALVDRYFPLEDDEIAALASGGVTTGLSTLERDENALDATAEDDKLVEVYLGTRTASGKPVLVETYTSYRVVTERAGELRRRFLPFIIGGMALVALAQVPLTLSAVRRLGRYQRDRERLLERVIDASDAERRRIAAEVHDGAVQDLAGVAFALAGASEAAEGPEQRERLRTLSADARGIVRSLRSLLTSIYPVEVPATGWVDGLADLTEQLRERGVTVHVEVPPLRLAPADELLFLRVAREALRNAVAHACATNVTLRAERRGGRLSLEVLDDGRGFTEDEAAVRPGEGHVGLRLLHDLAADVGADLTITSTPGAGTTVRLDVLEHA